MSIMNHDFFENIKVDSIILNRSHESLNIHNITLLKETLTSCEQIKNKKLNTIITNSHFIYLSPVLFHEIRKIEGYWENPAFKMHEKTNYAEDVGIINGLRVVIIEFLNNYSDPKYVIGVCSRSPEKIDREDFVILSIK